MTPKHPPIGTPVRVRESAINAVHERCVVSGTMHHLVLVKDSRGWEFATYVHCVEPIDEATGIPADALIPSDGGNRQAEESEES